jgi:hypothetical protein
MGVAMNGVPAWPPSWPDQWDGDDGKLWNQAKTAKALGWSLPTFKDRDVPCRRDGGNGRPYGYYLPEVWAWWTGKEAEQAARQAREAAEIEQAQLGLTGGESRDQTAGLAPDVRQKVLQNLLAEQKLRISQRDLVEAREVQDVFEGLLTRLARFLQSLPEAVGRELRLDGATIAALQEKLDGFQEGLAREMMARGNGYGNRRD